ncbi:hypothetical protein KSP40_PGU019602 [Platanthera guangdongensis]|uniref:Uncharacterized protein n=1 Tax=Platanthera guangdongensis TaxID=2320717 RepID=A0ABR2M7X4_9ASPA
MWWSHHRRRRSSFTQRLLLSMNRGGSYSTSTRGVRKKGTRNYLRDLILQHKLGLLGLLETKIENLLRSKIDKLAGRGCES